MKRRVVWLLVVCLCCLLPVLVTVNARADSGMLPLVIKFDSESSIEELAQVAAYADKGYVPRPLVYLQGKLVGSIPGEFRLPETKEPVAVEIGMPQLSTIPIYSFAVRPSELGKDQQTIEVVNSNFDFTRNDSANVWENVLLVPNTSQTIAVSRAETNYSIALPAKPYLELARFWLESEIKPYSPQWIDNIPAKNDSSQKGNIDHLVYDPVANEVTHLSATTNKTWSAGRATFLPFPMNQQVWLVRSIPANADVYTDLGFVGRTNIETTIMETSSFFIIVELAGYPACTHETGDVTEKEGIRTLTCKFK